MNCLCFPCDCICALVLNIHIYVLYREQYRPTHVKVRKGKYYSLHTCLQELQILADKSFFSRKVACKWGISNNTGTKRKHIPYSEHKTKCQNMIFLQIKLLLWVTIQQYTGPPRKWCMCNLVIFFFIIIAIISVLVQLLHNDSHSRYFVTQEQLKCIKTNKEKKSILSEIKMVHVCEFITETLSLKNSPLLKLDSMTEKKVLKYCSKYIIIILQCDEHQQVRLSDHWWVFIFLFFSFINKLKTHIACHYSNAHYRSIFTITILVKQIKNP